MANRKRPHFAGLWLSDAGKAEVERIVAREKLSKSATLRLMLVFAAKRMPEGWRP